MDLLLKSITGKDVEKLPALPMGLAGTAKIIQRAGLPDGKKRLEDVLEALKNKTNFFVEMERGKT